MLTVGNKSTKPRNPFENQKTVVNPIDLLYKKLDGDKLLLKIFSELNFRDLQSAGCVSTKWNEVYRNTGFNKKKEDSQNQIKHLAINVFNLHLPRDVEREIFSHLTFMKLLKTLTVSKTWQAGANESLWKAFLSEIAFGTKHYLKYFGLDVGVEPPLSPEIIKLWLQGSPFRHEGKQVRQRLFLVPAINLETLGKCIKEKYPEVGNESVYQHIVQSTEKCENPAKSYWVLMTEPLPEKQSQNIQIQEQFLIEKGKGSYRMPKALEIILRAFIEYALTKKHLYGQLNKSATFILCSDLKRNDKGIDLNVFVGAFYQRCLCVVYQLSNSNKTSCVVGVREKGLDA